LRRSDDIFSSSRRPLAPEPLRRTACALRAARRPLAAAEKEAGRRWRARDGDDEKRGGCGEWFTEC